MLSRCESQWPLVLVPVLAAMVLLGACASTNPAVIEEVEQDTGFGFDQMRGGSVVVLGICSRRSLLNDDERIDAGDDIADHFRKAFPEEAHIVTMSPGTLSAKFGSRRYEDLMRGCDREGMLGEVEIKAVLSVVPSSKYIILADLVTEETNSSSSTEWARKEGDSGYETTYEEGLALRIDVQLYDATEKSMVWRALVSHEKVDAKTVNTGDTIVESGITQIAYAIFGSPADMDRDELFGDMVERCVATLLQAAPNAVQPASP